MAASQDNIWGMSRLCIGMDEAQVLQVMNHPYSKKTIEHGEHVYHVWFYVTRPSSLAQSRMLPQNLTPLTFCKGVLQGWGTDYYHFLLQKKETPKSDVKDLKAPQDHSLEKAIETAEKPISKNDETKSQASDKKEDENQEEKDKEADEKEKAVEDDNDQNFNFW